MNRIHQSGLALFVSLVILVVLTLLGLGSYRSVAMQEKMGAAAQDRNIAMQTAESALREGERQGLQVLAANPAGPPAGSVCATGLCETPNAALLDRWDDDSGFAGWQNATTLTDNPTANPGQFVVEYMGEFPVVFGCDRQVPIEPTCVRPVLRTTARLDQSGANRATVLLQSNLRPPLGP